MKVQNVIEKWAKNIQQQVRFHFYEQYATEKSTREELLARNWVFHTDAFSTKKWDDGLGGILFPRGGKKKHSSDMAYYLFSTVLQDSKYCY